MNKSTKYSNTRLKLNFAFVNKKKNLFTGFSDKFKTKRQSSTC